jgi:Rieske Fe-S protein
MSSIKGDHMSNPNRRTVIKGLALSGAGVALGANLNAQGQTTLEKAIEIGEVAKLEKDFASIPFELADKTNAVLVRVPAPKDEAMLKSGRVVKSGEVYLSASALVCTHNGCKPAVPNAEGIMACPCHGAQFNADGSVAKGPAKKPLAGIKLEVKGGKVMAVGLLG